jgi:hypothetical protein
MEKASYFGSLYSFRLGRNSSASEENTSEKHSLITQRDLLDGVRLSKTRSKVTNKDHSMPRNC